MFAAARVLLFLLIYCGTLVVCIATDGPIRLIMFISGILLFEATKAKELTPPLSSYLGAAALVLALLGMLLHIKGPLGSGVQASILFACFFVLCLACFNNPTGWLARAFGWTPMRWLGNMSYSYYLLHGLALKAIILLMALMLPGVAFGSWVF